MAILATVSCGDRASPGRSEAVPAVGDTVAMVDLKVGFVYVGPIGDAGWTFAHDQGRRALETRYRGLKTVYVENVKEGADAERVLTRLAQEGCALVFATSFGYMDAVLATAAKYPRVAFMHATGFKRDANVGTYFGRAYQTIYLAGLAGGALTTSGKIGFVAPVPIPEIIRHINAFTLGAREANPSCTVHVVWTNAWYDPAAEKDAALSLMDTGCDVIMTEGDSPAPLQAAEERGAFAIGYNSDARAFAPTRFITAAVWDWSVLYSRIVDEVLAGIWKAEDYWWGIETGITKLAPWGPAVPETVRQRVGTRQREITDGSFDVFHGPIIRQDGTEAYPAGARATDEELLSMSYFVQGVAGTIPK
jgi:basic membrane protein A